MQNFLSVSQYIYLHDLLTCCKEGGVPAKQVEDGAAII